MNAEENYATKEKRIYWMDNLRSITILLVVLYHVGGVYESGQIQSARIAAPTGDVVFDLIVRSSGPCHRTVERLGEQGGNRGDRSRR